MGIILASYPSANPDAVGGYFKMAVESVSEFPSEVLQALCNPKTGIMTTNKFLPSIAELRSFCHRVWDRTDPRDVEGRTDEIKRLYGRVERQEEETASERRAKRNEVLESFRQLSSDLRMCPDPYAKRGEPSLNAVESKAAAERWLEEQLKREPVPLTLSPALFATLGLESD